MNDSVNRTTESRAGRAGRPPLPPIALAFVVLFVASLALPIALAGGDVYPSPFGTEHEIVTFFRDHDDAVRVMSLLQFAAALPFAIYAAVVSDRLRTLGVRAPGPIIGLSGGLLASASMALSALLSWTLTRPEVLDHPELIRLLHDLTFMTGGPGFIVPSGLLLAGIAVPGLLAGLLPRWFAWTGLAIAAVALAATLTVALPDLAVLLPIARFPSMIWLVASAFLLGRAGHR